MKKIEADIAAMQDRLEAVNDEAQRLEKQLDALTAEIEANPPKSIEDAEKSIQAMEKMNDTLSHYEQELSKIRKDSEIRDRQQKEIRVRAATHEGRVRPAQAGLRQGVQGRPRAAAAAAEPASEKAAADGRSRAA